MSVFSGISYYNDAKKSLTVEEILKKIEDIIADNDLDYILKYKRIKADNKFGFNFEIVPLTFRQQQAMKMLNIDLSTYDGEKFLNNRFFDLTLFNNGYFSTFYIFSRNYKVSELNERLLFWGNECAEPLLQYLEGETDEWNGDDGFEIEEAFLSTEDPCSSVESWIEDIIFDRAYKILEKK
ncbi:MAG: hypothetical protein Q4C95_11815 [Planctomycetia bacterium]|nr:hypothetical protein [Planctomycetia bacterium]